MVCADSSGEDDYRALSFAMGLQEQGLPYNLATRNCAHVARAIMNAAGLSLGSPFFDSPSKLRRDFPK